MGLARNLGTFSANVNSSGTITTVPTSSLTGTVSATQVANNQTYGINISGNAGTATSATNATNLSTTNFTISQSGTNLLIKYNGNTIITISSTGDISANTLGATG